MRGEMAKNSAEFKIVLWLSKMHLMIIIIIRNGDTGI